MSLHASSSKQDTRGYESHVRSKSDFGVSQTSLRHRHRHQPLSQFSWHLLEACRGERDRCERACVLAGKAAQERVARVESPGVTIIRSTQWFEFAQQNLDRFTFGPFALIPAMTIKPVALDAVAAVIADTVVGDRTGSCDVSGP